MSRCLRIDEYNKKYYDKGKIYEFFTNYEEGKIFYFVRAKNSTIYPYSKIDFNVHFIDIKQLREVKLKRILK